MSPIQPEDGFAEFWAAYPTAANRRVGKPQAMRKWAALGLAKYSQHIIAHVHHMKTEDAWLRGFHPLVLTYLNQQRWLDWIPPIVTLKPKEDPALAKIKANDRLAVRPSEEIRKRMKELRG